MEQSGKLRRRLGIIKVPKVLLAGRLKAEYYFLCVCVCAISSWCLSNVRSFYARDHNHNHCDSNDDDYDDGHLAVAVWWWPLWPGEHSQGKLR